MEEYVRELEKALEAQRKTIRALEDTLIMRAQEDKHPKLVPSITSTTLHDFGSNHIAPN